MDPPTVQHAAVGDRPPPPVCVRRCDNWWRWATGGIRHGERRRGIFFFASDSAGKLRVGRCPRAFGADSGIPPDTGKPSG